MKIGIGYTTKDNPKFELYVRTMLSLSCPDSVLIVVDDGSAKEPELCNYHFEQSVGIARAKNKLIELLYNQGVTDFFIFDDDLFSNLPEWWMPYINSGLNHACWNYDRRLISANWQNKDGKHVPHYNEYETPNGCMLYLKRICFDTVGAWDTDFTGYAYEHVNLSDRIFNMGLTPARYIDVPNSAGLFHMVDRPSSIPNHIRGESIPVNRKLWQDRLMSKEFKEFRND